MQKTVRAIIDQNAALNNIIQGALSSPWRSAKEKGCLKITFRPIRTKEGIFYQITEFFPERALHTNVHSAQLGEIIEVKLLHEFKQGALFTKHADYYLFAGKTGKIRIVQKPPSKETREPSHNRPKNHILQEGDPVPYLCELGVMDRAGKVLAKKSDKFKQINRFLEVIRDILPYLEHKERLRIVDFGCGKAYLTFALYHYLRDLRGIEVEMLGMDLKQDVVNFCRGLAGKLDFQGLEFAVGDINSLAQDRSADLVVSLHACDTATDAALEKGIRWRAEVILAVPCCQHELYKQVDNAVLAPLLNHGILKERFAALTTDAARAQLLEILGYHCQIMEFIDMEHTPKNLLIKAVRASGQPEMSLPRKIKSYIDFKKALHICPSLERRFLGELQSMCENHGIGHG